MLLGNAQSSSVQVLDMINANKHKAGVSDRQCIVYKNTVFFGNLAISMLCNQIEEFPC